MSCAATLQDSGRQRRSSRDDHFSLYADRHTARNGINLDEDSDAELGDDFYGEHYT